MLLHTNFIADRLAQRRYAARLARLGVRTTIVVWLLLLLPPLLLDSVAGQRAAALLAVKTRRADVTAAAAETAWLRGEMNRLQLAHSLTTAVHANDALWLDLLAELRDRLPAGVWLAKLEVAAPATDEAGTPQPRRLVLTGRAEEHASIGAYLAALNQSPWLAGAALIESAPTEGTTGPFEFRIEAPLSHPLPELPGAAP